MNNNTINKRLSGKRPKKRKRNNFQGNQHTKHGESDKKVSASARKLTKTCEEIDNSANGNFYGYSIIDRSLLFTDFEQWLCCIVCHSKVSITTEVVCGLHEKVSVCCDSCGVVCVTRNSKMVGKRKNASDVNRRFTLAMRSIGKGHAESATFCGIMDLPKPVTQKSYDKIVQHVREAAHNNALIS